ncbi:glycoside hydrolase superfamily [Spinellus fusiger]|nr:glycoside hydrolase superfamily [Spinellus fusiger]
MSIKKEIGQLLIYGFHGVTPTEDILNLIRNHNLGAIILFSRNIESPEQIRALTYTLQQTAHASGHVRPLLIAVDQENGVVRRLGRSGTYLPGSMALGAINSTQAAYDVASAVADELLCLGINWNLAPVMDVNNNPFNPVIGVRSFGEDPDLVAKLGIAQVEAYQNKKVVTSIKHFPGHGDTATDSHVGVPVIDKSLEELERFELKPFRQAIQKSKGNQVPASVMVGHMSLPQIIKEPRQVSSLSPEIVHLLRKDIGYEGVIVTDCLEMEAVKETIGTPTGTVVALQAGNDIVMVSHTYAFQYEALQKLHTAIDHHQLDTGALEASLKRVSDLKDKYLTWEDTLAHKPLVVGCPQHVALSGTLYDQIPTVVRNSQQLLPIKPAQQDRILFLGAQIPVTLAIDSEKEPFKAFELALKQRSTEAECILFNEETNTLEEKIKQADWVIIGTGNANLYPFQADMVRLAHRHARRLVVVAVMNPYDIMVFSDIDAYIVTYEYNPPAMESAVKLIFGEIETHSQLPVTIPIESHNTLPVTWEAWTVETYTPEMLEEVWQLWTVTFKALPLSLDVFRNVLLHLQSPEHCVVKHENKIVGFAGSQVFEQTGQLALLMVQPDYQSRGIGTVLYQHTIDTLRQKEIVSIRIGSTFPRFFPGVPNDDDVNGKKAQAYFERRGCQMGEIVWDLVGDLTHYKTPTVIRDRMKKEGLWFGRLLPHQLNDLIQFQSRYFPYWVSTYKHHTDLGDFQDVIVAREQNKDGNIVGSLILHAHQQSHPDRNDLIWTDPLLLGPKSGGMACVGVSEEARGRGIGLGIVAYANEVLQARHIETSYVDWVVAVDFYKRTSYEVWRSYRICTLNK